MFSSRRLTAVLALAACLLVVASGAGLKRKTLKQRLNDVEAMIPEPFSKLYNKYLSEEERDNVKDIAFKSAAVATLFVPKAFYEIGEAVLEEFSAEDDEAFKNLGMMTKSRTENTCKVNKKFVEQTQKEALALFPKEAQQLLNKFLDNEEDLALAKQTAFKVAAFVPEAVAGLYKSFESSDRQQLKDLALKYFDATVEMVPEAKWALDVYNQMAKQDFVAVKDMALRADQFKSEEEVLSVLKEKSQLLHSKVTELRQKFDRKVEALNEEARTFVKNLESRAYTLVSAVRDNEDFMQTYEQALDSAVKSAKEFRALSSQSLDSLEEQFPQQARLGRAFNVAFDKAVETTTYVKEHLDKAN